MDAWYKLLAKECRDKGNFRIYPTFSNGIVDYVNPHITRYYPIWKEIGLSINHIERDDPYPFPHTHGPWYQSTILEGSIKEIRNGKTFIHNKDDTYYVGEEIHHQIFVIEEAWTMMLFHGPTKTTTEFVTPNGIIPAYKVLLDSWDIKEIMLPSDYQNPLPDLKVKITVIPR